MEAALHRLKDGKATPKPVQKTSVSVCILFVADIQVMRQVNSQGSSASFQFDKVLPGPYVGMLHTS